MSSRIDLLHARRIWDSRGRPTIEIEIRLASGARGRAAAPAGASRGLREAVDLRDGGAAFGGFDVDRAIANANGEIARLLVGREADQAEIDTLLVSCDGTETLSRLGGNTIVATSLALLEACAAERSLPLWRHLADGKKIRLPLPEIQIFGGGAHAGRRTDVQDFMIMVPGAPNLSRAFEITADVYRAAGALLAEEGRLSGTADEGGWWPNFKSNEDALATLTRAIERAGYRPGSDVFISLDIAASELWNGSAYVLAMENRTLISVEMVAMVADWTERYPILSIEDPVDQSDETGMRSITQRLGKKVQIVGDDFLVTNAALVQKAAAAGACNCALIKVNQAGTVTRARAALEEARKAGWAAIVSARSGETEDVWLSHLGTGWDAGQVKVGSFARSERMAKWNELLRIEEQLGADAVFAGWSALPAGIRR